MSKTLNKTVALQVGIIPGGIDDFICPVGMSVKDVLANAAKELDFSFSTEPYQKGDKTMVDVPVLDGINLCTLYEGGSDAGKVKDVLWDTLVADESATLVIIPLIKGNQGGSVIVTVVASVPGCPGDFGLSPDAKTVADALEVAGVTMKKTDCALVNDIPADMDAELANDDVVTVRPEKDVKIAVTVVVGDGEPQKAILNGGGKKNLTTLIRQVEGLGATVLKHGQTVTIG